MSDYNDYNVNSNSSGNEEYNEYNNYGGSEYPASENPNTYQAQESSYEWNSEASADGEYRHSYVNGNNSDAPHNPNNYEQAYSTPNDNYQYNYDN